jgi:hypothetical protein
MCALAYVLVLSVAVVVPAQSAAPLPVKELTELTSDLPPDIREGILARPRTFLDSAAALLRVPPELLVIVDKQHPLEPGCTPADLVPASTTRSSRPVCFSAAC